MFDVILASSAGLPVRRAADHLAEPDRDVRWLIAAIVVQHSNIVSCAGTRHVVEVVVDPDRVVAELLGQHRDLDRLAPTWPAGPSMRGQLHLPALRDEHSEDHVVAHGRTIRREGMRLRQA